MTTRLMIGSDPEFAVKRKGDRRATRAINVIEGSVRDKIGLDGCPDVGEFRPDPATTVAGHIQNIEELVVELVSKHPTYFFYAGSSHSRYPIGGHIHFSGPGCGAVTPSSKVVKCLDAFLAVPVMMMEGKKAARSRRRLYGRLSDSRQQPHGGFEYRTLPSWLISKDMAKAVLEVAFLIVQCKSEISQEAIDEVGLDAYGAMRRFNSCDKHFFKPKMETIFATLRGLSKANLVMESIDYLETFIDERKSWKQGKSFNRRWQLHLRDDSRATSQGRTRPRRRASRRFRIVGTPGDLMTEEIAAGIRAAGIEGTSRTTYQLYGLSDHHEDVDITISETGITLTNELIGSARGMGLHIQQNTNFGRAPPMRTVRIGITRRARAMRENAVTVLLRHIITQLESGL